MATLVLDRIAERIASARVVTVLTGAGISTDSGIPDFRGPQGVWTRDPTAERQATIDAWVADPQLRRQAWQFRLAHRASTIVPNRGHQALASLERLGRVTTLVTQNVDGLHRDAGTSADRLVEIHGTMRDVVCLGCGRRTTMSLVLDRVAAGDDDPHCLACGGLLKSATISFGQSLEAADVERARDAAAGADVFLALGTTLSVFPVAYLPRIARDNGAHVVIVNGQPTEQDHVADHVLLGKLGFVLPALVSRVERELASA
jgi:NAD-dependent deacetylase